METFKELEHPVNVDFGPRDVKFPKYGNTIGKAEADEIVLSLLEVWQQNKDWKAVFTGAICKKLHRDPEPGMKYLLGNKYLDVQRYVMWNDMAIYLAPTAKLLDVMRPFVQK